MLCKLAFIKYDSHKILREHEPNCKETSRIIKKRKENI